MVEGAISPVVEEETEMVELEEVEEVEEVEEEEVVVTRGEIRVGRTIMEVSE